MSSSFSYDNMRGWFTSLNIVLKIIRDTPSDSDWKIILWLTRINRLVGKYDTSFLIYQIEKYSEKHLIYLNPNDARYTCIPPLPAGICNIMEMMLRMKEWGSGETLVLPADPVDGRVFPVGGQTASRGLPHTGCEVEVVAGTWPAPGFSTLCRVYVLGVATPALLCHKEPALAFKANYPSKDLFGLCIPKLRLDAPGWIFMV